MRAIRRGVLAASAIALAAIGLPFSPAAKAADTTPTNFYYRGTGFGTEVVGGVLPASSGKTAYSVLPCTRAVPMTAENQLAGVQLGDLVKVGAITTTNSSKRQGNTHVSVTQTRVASVRIGTNLAHLRLTGVNTIARAWHDGNDFQKRRWVNIGDGELVLGGVPVASFDLNQLFTPKGVTIPGIATVKGRFGGGQKTATGAWIKATGLRVQLLPVTGTPATIDIGRAFAAIDAKGPGPQVRGNAYAAQAVAAGGVVKAGKVAMQPLPCKGTDGKWLENATAGINIPNVIKVGAAQSRTFSRFVNRSTFARGESDVASVNLLNGALRIEGVHTQGLVQKKPDKTYIRSANGTTVARIIVNGNEIALPKLGETIEIPGIAKITLAKREVLPRGMRLTGIEVELLSGNLATVEIGSVNLFVM